MACEVARWITSVVGLRGSRTDGDVLVAGELPRQRPRCRRDLKRLRCRRVPVSRSLGAGSTRVLRAGLREPRWADGGGDSGGGAGGSGKGHCRP
jgi:hypothetical protein